MENQISNHNLGNLLKRKAVSECADSFFHNTDPSLNLWDMLSLASQVDSGSIRVGSYHSCQWFKFTISTDSGNLETTASVQSIDNLERLVDSLQLPGGQMCVACEIDLPTEGDKEWNLGNKENVDGQVNFLVQRQIILGDFQFSSRDSLNLLSDCLAFQSSHIFAPNLLGIVNIINCHWTIGNLVAGDGPFEVLQ